MTLGVLSKDSKRATCAPAKFWSPSGPVFAVNATEIVTVYLVYLDVHHWGCVFTPWDSSFQSSTEVPQVRQESRFCYRKNLDPVRPDFAVIATESSRFILCVVFLLFSSHSYPSFPGFW